MTKSPWLIVAGAAAFATLGPGATVSSAHPLGNLTVNTSARIVVAPETTTIGYVLDLAELPTVQEQPVLDAQGVGYAARKCASLLAGVSLQIDGDPVALSPGQSNSALLPGQGGLSTLRVECTWSTLGVSDRASLHWTDDNLTDRLGWREVIAVGDGTVLDTDLASISTSDLLRAYPAAVPAPRQLDARITATVGGPRLPDGTSGANPTAPDIQSRGADGLTQRFNRLVGQRDLTTGLALAAAGIALLLGALHSLAPGHGKTLMAAMVASRRGTVGQVLTVGATVAATHTVGVVVLGVIISTSQAVAPDRVLPWLTVASGVMLLATGTWLLGRRLVPGAAPAGHHHGVFGGDAHAHHGHGLSQPSRTSTRPTTVTTPTTTTTTRPRRPRPSRRRTPRPRPFT